ncbi:DNA replication/repair protein RecF, partial [Anaerostipes sp.]|uniref:DNA replication/repair protein RecF n=1 Tax=Anaerostipes sp. TaxID=1872530 RepID=UPI003FEE7CE4
MQRNNLLKQLKFQPNLVDTLEFWDLQLVKYGSEVIRYRRKFIDHLNMIIKQIHRKLTGNQEEIQLEYENNVEYDIFLTELNKKRSIDLKYTTTSIGPHRDDISFIVNGIDIRKFGSQGQQRTAALSLKLSQIQFVKEVLHDTPVLLLDDVLSELDSNRKIYLLESIKDTQTFITCTGLDEFISQHLPVQRMFQIKEGKIIKQN